MQILNVHERRFTADPSAVGALLDTLSSADDRLWPGAQWWPMLLDRPLGPGAHGGHGPVRYRVTEYAPGRLLRFAMGEEPGRGVAGLDGHEFEVLPAPGGAVLRHRLWGPFVLQEWPVWSFVVRPAHDALLEDLLDNAERELTGGVARPARWSLWVRLVRRMMINR
jgi:hypothetical protein